MPNELNNQAQQNIVTGSEEAKPGYSYMNQVIGREQIAELTSIFTKYHQGKESLEQRLQSNEKWYRNRHWEEMRRSGEGQEEIEPVSAWMFNAIINKHADAMDNYPTPNILPREPDDVEEAERLSSIIPVLLKQSKFIQEYSKAWDDKIKNGTAVYGIFWDSYKNSIGDVNIKAVDLLNLFWKPGIEDIQDSPYLFYASYQDNKTLESVYPELRGKLSGYDQQVRRYENDESLDEQDETLVIECYYKIQYENKTVLHYVKYVNDTVLYATENDPEYKDRGLYDHGKYPFVIDKLYRIKDSVSGFGIIDVGKSCQEYIDRLDKAAIENILQASGNRVGVSEAAGFHEEEFLDLKNKVVHFSGSLDDSQYKVLTTPVISEYVMNVKDNKVNELKEVTGNRDVNTGGSASGITAASAIAALQEAGSKLSRDIIKHSYDAFEEVVLFVIELIRQFYTEPRNFRIQSGESPSEFDFASYDNTNIRPQSQGGIEFGQDSGYRLPLFDVDVSAEKASPYSKMETNELALNFYAQGFFNPQMTDQSLSCLEMMDFYRKDKVVDIISRKGDLYQQNIARTQQCLALAQMLDQATGSNYADMIAAEINGMSAPPVMNGEASVPENNQMLGGNKAESSVTANARAQTAERSTPR